MSPIAQSVEGVKPGQYVMISVTDTGTGMSQEVIDKAFDPFFTTKPAGAGTGLGLSQVYGFVKQSGGHVRIYSEIGEGTTVKIYLPRSFAAQQGRERRARAPESREGTTGNRAGGRGRRRRPRLCGRDLARPQLPVLEAADGEAALVLRSHESDPIDLLLTDVVMPGMNGRALAEAAQRHRPGLKVLYMTGYSRNAIVHQGRLDPGVSLMQKPFSQNVLAARVHGALSAGAN